MRWLFNSILVLIGLPLVGACLGLIGCFVPRVVDDPRWPAPVFIFGVWASSLALFALVYVVRTRWLERTGIYTSWSSFEAYVRENHRYPFVSEEEKSEFLSWAELSRQRPARFRKIMKTLYVRIHAEIDSEEQRNSYIKCLAWYALPWPVREDWYLG